MGLGNKMENLSVTVKKPAGPTPAAAELRRTMGESPGCLNLKPDNTDLLWGPDCSFPKSVARIYG